MLVVAVAASLATYGAASAAIGTALGAAGGTFATASTAAGASAGLGNAVLSAAIAGVVSSSASQLVGTGKLDLGSAFEAGAVAAITAGLMNGITYSNQSGLGFTTSPIASGSGVQSLGSLAGVQPVMGTSVNQAASSTATLIEERGLAMLASGVINAGVGTAIEGGSFLSALKGSLVSEVAAVGANVIGDEANVNGSPIKAGSPAYWLAHAALGCLASAADGTGCAGGAIGGAASAAFSPDLLKAIDPTGAELSPGQQAMMAGFATLLGGGLAELAGTNALGGATAAQNEVLNNTDNHPQDAKNGGFLNAVGNWLQNTYGDPVGSVQNWINQFTGQVQAGAQAKASESPSALVAQSVANGVNAVMGVGGGLPPAAGFDPVLAGAGGGQATSAVTGGAPSNAILSSGNSGNDGGSATGQGPSTNTAQQGLDWSIVSKSGETRADHIVDQHGDLNLNKPIQGVFYGDPVSTVNDAWNTVQQTGIQPVTSGDTDIYVVPRSNSGYAGGYTGQRQNLNSVTIITVHGTNQVITAFPGNGFPLPKAP
ncbi:DUF637 domain-containing protein [Burkholderia glumae]